MEAIKQIRPSEYTVDREVLHQIMRRSMNKGEPENVCNEMQAKIDEVSRKLAAATAEKYGFNRVFIIL